MFQKVQTLRFHDNRHMKVVKLSALRTGRLYPPGNNRGTHFCYRLSRPQGHSAAGRIMSMKNSNDTVGNRTVGILVILISFEVTNRVALQHAAADKFLPAVHTCNARIHN